MQAGLLVGVDNFKAKANVKINCNKKTHPIIKFPSNPIELSINNNGGLIIRKAIMVDLYHPGALPRNNFWTSLNIKTF